MTKEYFDVDELSSEGFRSEQEILALMVTAARIYLQGNAIFDASRSDRGRIICRESKEVIRGLGRLMAVEFNISAPVAAYVAQTAANQVEGWPEGKTDLGSFISARLAEGFTEVGQRDLAAELFELKVEVPDDQEEMFAYLLEKDANLQVSTLT